MEHKREGLHIWMIAWSLRERETAKFGISKPHFNTMQHFDNGQLQCLTLALAAPHWRAQATWASIKPSLVIKKNFDSLGWQFSFDCFVY